MHSRLLTVGAATVLAACAESFSDVGKSLDRFIADDSSTIISLADFKLDAWDKLCVLGPYLSKERQKQILGFDAPPISTTDDSQMWLVFISQSKVVSSLSYDRSRGDFVEVENQCFARDDANFTKEVQDQTHEILIKHARKK